MVSDVLLRAIGSKDVVSIDTILKYGGCRHTHVIFAIEMELGNIAETLVSSMVDSHASKVHCLCVAVYLSNSAYICALLARLTPIMDTRDWSRVFQSCHSGWVFAQLHASAKQHVEKALRSLPDDFSRMFVLCADTNHLSTLQSLAEVGSAFMSHRDFNRDIRHIMMNSAVRNEYTTLKTVYEYYSEVI